MLPTASATIATHTYLNGFALCRAAHLNFPQPSEVTVGKKHLKMGMVTRENVDEEHHEGRWDLHVRVKYAPSEKACVDTTTPFPKSQFTNTAFCSAEQDFWDQEVDYNTQFFH